MNFDPKKDTRFQAILAGIVDGAASFATEASAEGSEKGTTGDLDRLRVEFFWTCCFYEVYSAGDRQSAYDAYVAVRDTPAAQQFLRENPYHFAQIDLALCKVANSIRKEWKEAARALNQ